MIVGRKIRVLVVDDSAIVRKMIADSIRSAPDIEVVGLAADPFIARDLIVQNDPDVVTLDIEMPRMDGITFLKKLMQHRPLPVIIVSSLTQSGSVASIEALRAGAIDVIPKPGGPYSVGQVADHLLARIRAVAQAKAISFKPMESAAAPKAPSGALARARRAHGLVVIGASTGGTRALEALLTRLPGDCPPILIAQHMPARFTKAYADRLDGVCETHVAEAQGGELLRNGVAYIAPGDFHMLVESVGVQLRTVVRQGPPVHHQRPAVDVLFHSAAKLRGVPTLGILLTGMGCDGADGMVALRAMGAETIAEDERSCVVFGMPREAIARGGAKHVATLLDMPDLIFDCFDRLTSSERVASRSVHGTNPAGS